MSSNIENKLRIYKRADSDDYLSRKIKSQIEGLDASSLVDNIKDFVLPRNSEYWNPAMDVIIAHGTSTQKNELVRVLLYRGPEWMGEKFEQLVKSYSPPETILSILIQSEHIHGELRRFVLHMVAKRRPSLALRIIDGEEMLLNYSIKDEERTYLFQNVDLEADDMLAHYEMYPNSTLDTCIRAMRWAKNNGLETLPQYKSILDFFMGSIGRANERSNFVFIEQVLEHKLVPDTSREAAELIIRLVEIRSYICKTNNRYYTAPSLILLAMTLDGLFGSQNPHFWNLLNVTIKRDFSFEDVPSHLRNAAISLIVDAAKNGVFSLRDSRIIRILFKYLDAKERPSTNPSSNMEIAENELIRPKKRDSYKNFMGGMFGK